MTQVVCVDCRRIVNLEDTEVAEVDGLGLPRHRCTNRKACKAHKRPPLPWE